MKTTTTAQNQNTPTRGRDLGQISLEAVFYAGNAALNLEPGWQVKVTNASGHEFRVIPRDDDDKARLLDVGYEFREGFGGHLTPYKLHLTLADLTSTSKDDREYGKTKVRYWAETGKEVHKRAREVIAEAKKPWCVVVGPGLHYEEIVSRHDSWDDAWKEANSYIKNGELADVARALSDFSGITYDF